MSLDLGALKIFVRVAELRSFTQAAKQLGMPKARASASVQRLETELGTQLLQRTTRLVRLTTEGEQLLKRAHGLLAEADEIATLFQAGRALKGTVRVELPVLIARDMIVPALPDLLELHPQLRVEICASDRLVAAAREGFDVVLRIGPVSEPGLVGKRIGMIPMMNCASPAYLRKYGTPISLDDLSAHMVVHYAADSAAGFEYFDGTTYRDLPMRSSVTVDNFDVYEAAGIAGLGIVQLPRPGQHRHLDTLVEILPQLTARPTPVSVLHTHGRSVPRRVRAVMSWLIERLAPTVRALVPSEAEAR